MKITNDVIYQELKDFRKEFNTFKEDDYKPLKNDCKLNTEYRQKATGIMAVIVGIGAFVGTIAIWILNKVWK